VEGTQGNISKVSYDTLSPTRCLTLLISYWYEQEGTYPKEVLAEVSDNLFRWPFVEQAKLKGMITTLKVSAFDLATKGTNLEWALPPTNLRQTHLTSFRLKEIPGNDKIHYELQKDKLDGELEKLREAGYVKLAETYYNNIRMDVTEENIKLMSLFLNPHLLCGFSRGLSSAAHKAQVEKKPEFDPEGVTMGPLIKEKWMDLMRRTSAIKYMPWTESRFLENLPRLQTSRSAGGERFKFDVSLPYYVPGSQRRGKFFSVSLTFTDKMMVFLGKGSKVISQMRVLKPSDATDYYKTGNRDTQGRNPRAIFMIPIHEYSAEAVVALPIFDLVTQFPRGYYEDPLDDDSIFIIGKEEGFQEIDHAYGMMASSSWILILLADFSQFDSTQAWENMRKYMVEAMEAIAVEMGWDKTEGGFLGYGSFMEMYIRLLKNRKETWFQLGKDGEIVGLDQLLSGEFLTIMINGVTNQSNMKDFMQEMLAYHRRVLEKMRLVKASIQGDDSVQFWENLSSVTTDNISELLDVFVAVSARNGMDLNWNKTTTRYFFYEYLKKVCVYGRSVGLFSQTLPLSAETRADLTPVDRMKSWIATFNVSVSRGQSLRLCYNTCLAGWSFMRRHKQDLRKVDRKTISYFLPYGVLYLPTDLGGVGLSRHGLILASKDLIIGYRESKNPMVREMFNKAAHIMDVSYTNVSRELSGAAYEGRMTRPKDAMKYAKDYFKKYVLIPSRLREAALAERRLGREGVKVGRMAYRRSVQMSIENSISSTRKVQQLNVKKALDETFKHLRRFDDDIIRDYMKKYDWAKWLTIEKLTPIERVLEEPIRAGLSKPLRMLQLQLGHVTAQNEYIPNPERLLNFLRRDPHFPRHITKETILGLLSKPRLCQNTDLMVDMLIAIGVGKDIAAEAVNTFLKSGRAFQIYLNSKISKRDTFVPILDFSERKLEQILDVLPSGLRYLDLFLRELAFGYLLDEAQTDGYGSKIRVTYNDKGRADILNYLREDTKLDIVRYLGLYDDVY
jgi:hypothetical protein